MVICKLIVFACILLLLLVSILLFMSRQLVLGYILIILALVLLLLISNKTNVENINLDIDDEIADDSFDIYIQPEE